jgi:hypothetical protein
MQIAAQCFRSQHQRDARSGRGKVRFLRDYRVALVVTLQTCEGDLTLPVRFKNRTGRVGIAVRIRNAYRRIKLPQAIGLKSGSGSIAITSSECSMEIPAFHLGPVRAAYVTPNDFRLSRFIETTESDE